MNILFVCAQNVGRSQTAAALYNKYADEGHADSAGTRVEKPGETIRERAAYSNGAKNVIECMKEEGINVASHTRRQVTRKMLKHYDRVIVMSEPEYVPGWLSETPKYEYWFIEDPRYKGIDEARKTQDLIKEKVLGLIGAKTNPRG